MNTNEPEITDDVEGHGLFRNAALATAIAVGGGTVAMAGPASAEQTCVSTTEKACVDTADEVTVVDAKEADTVTESAAGFVIGLLVRGTRR